MLSVEDIHVYYGDSHVLQGMSLTLNEGEIVCLLGRNGAGKTTTLRGIVGFAPPKRGRVVFGGETISGRPVFENVRRGIGYVPEDRRIFSALTVAENLEVAALPPRPDREAWTRDRIFEVFPLLADLRHRRGGDMSGGEQQMLAVARALAGNPRLLLLDEPCEGLAPVIVEKLGTIIADLAGQIPILLAEQNAVFALAVADRGYVVEKGRIQFSGDRDELRNNREVQDRYLAV